jgi:hypothetical protein
MEKIRLELRRLPDAVPDLPVERAPDIQAQAERAALAV